MAVLSCDYEGDQGIYSWLSHSGMSDEREDLLLVKLPLKSFRVEVARLPNWLALVYVHLIVTSHDQIHSNWPNGEHATCDYLQ